MKIKDHLNFITPTSIQKINDEFSADLDSYWEIKAENDARLAGRYHAKEVFDYLQERMDLFQKDLKEDEELGIRLANFGAAADLHVRSINYSNPNLIEFSGVNPEGHETTLVQHVSQLSFMLLAMKPVEKHAFRIGFVIRDDD